MKTASEFNELSERILSKHLPKLAEEARILSQASNALMAANEESLMENGAREAGRCRNACDQLVALAKELQIDLE